jgi:hypothetical protein
VPAVLASATGSNWTAGGSIFTFYFPIGLFVVIAALLCLQFARPHKIPGHRNLAASAAGPATAQPAAKTMTPDAAGPEDAATNAASPPSDDTG